MHFALTEEQQALADSLRKFLPAAVAREAPTETATDAPSFRVEPTLPAHWATLAEYGVIAAAFDEAHHGFAGDSRTIAVVLAALGEALAGGPYLASAIVAGRLLQLSATPHASKLIEQSIAGASICIVAHDGGTDPFASPAVRLNESAAQPLLSGTLNCVRHAAFANTFLVPALAHDEVTIYCVPRQANGVSVSSFRLIDGEHAGVVSLNAVPASACVPLDFASGGRDALHDAIEWGLLGLCAEAAGIIASLNRATFAYLATRRQFGVPLASFQALQHRAADMHIASEELFAAVNYAIDSCTATRRAARTPVYAAKVVADVAGRRVAHEAVQMHGGMGVSDELDVSHYARRLTAIRSELGAANVHRLRFSSLQ